MPPCGRVTRVRNIPHRACPGHGLVKKGSLEPRPETIRDNRYIFVQGGQTAPPGGLREEGAEQVIADKFVDLYDLHRFAVVRRLTALEQQVIADAKSGWNKSLAGAAKGDQSKAAP